MDKFIIHACISIETLKDIVYQKMDKMHPHRFHCAFEEHPKALGFGVESLNTWSLPLKTVDFVKNNYPLLVTPEFSYEREARANLTQLFGAKLDKGYTFTEGLMSYFKMFETFTNQNKQIFFIYTPYFPSRYDRFNDYLRWLQHTHEKRNEGCFDVYKVYVDYIEPSAKNFWDYIIILDREDGDKSYNTILGTIKEFITKKVFCE